MFEWIPDVVWTILTLEWVWPGVRAILMLSLLAGLIGILANGGE